MIALARSPLAFALAFALAIRPEIAHAQQDEFDFEPRQARTTVGTPAPPPVDSVVSAAAAARVVGIVVVRGLEFPGDGRLACARGRVARGTTSNSVGFVTPDGTTVVVPSRSVEDAIAIVVHGADPRDVRAAFVGFVDAARGLAFLRLASPYPASTEVSAPTPPVEAPMTALSRAPDGSLGSEPAQLRVVGAQGIGVAIDGAGLDEARVLFRDGAPVGLTVGNRLGGLPYFAMHAFGAMNEAFERSLAETATTLDAGLGRAIEDASELLVALSTSPDDAAQCAALSAARTDDPPTIEDLMRTSSSRLRVLFAALEWNRAVSAVESPDEPWRDSAPFVLVRAARAQDVAGTNGIRFVVQVLTIDREESARLARVESERRAREERAEEARRAQERRDRRAATYQVGLAAAFARDGSSGLGGAMFTGGVFGSIPRLSSSDTFQTSLAVGASAALGPNGGMSALLTLDLGVSMRIGGDRGGFVLLAYSPGLTSRELAGGSVFVASSYRLAVGVALERRVVYLGTRVVAPSGDYPLYLLEIGAAFRHGPPRVRAESTDVRTAARTTARQ